MNVLTDQIVRHALKYVRTTGDSPLVKYWLSRVGGKRGDPWAIPFAWCVLDDACEARRLHNRIAPCEDARVFMELARVHNAWTRDASPGCIFGIDLGSKDARGVGHCGVIIEVDPDGVCKTIEGPASLAGGCGGNSVEIRTRIASEFTLGFLDPGQLFT